MADEKKKPEELAQIDYAPPKKDWTDPKVEFKKGSFNYGSNPENVEYLGLPYARAFDPRNEDWNLPENWKEIVLKGIKERLDKYRTFKVFMDICVRCGACADICPLCRFTHQGRRLRSHSGFHSCFSEDDLLLYLDIDISWSNHGYWSSGCICPSRNPTYP